MPGPDPALRRATALLLTLAVIAAGFAASLAAAPAARAHDQLISSNPADGEVLADAPAAVELLFSAELMDLGNEVRVEDAAGADVTDGPLRLERETLSQPLTALDDGTYQVTWRAVSSDGHPITGRFSFEVGSGSGDAAETPAAQDQPGGPDAADASPTPEAAQTEDGDESSGLPGWVPAAGVGALAGLGLYLAAVALFRRIRRNR